MAMTARKKWTRELVGDVVKTFFPFLPLSHVFANWMLFPPTPQNASTMMSHLQRSAVKLATFSGVTENQLSEMVKKLLVLRSLKES
jgi:hypothetical protein